MEFFHISIKKLNMTFAGGLEGAVQTWLRLLPFHWLIPIRPYSLSLIHQQPSLLAVNVQSLSQWISHVWFQKVARLCGPRVNFPSCLSVATSSWHRLTRDTHYVPWIYSRGFSVYITLIKGPSSLGSGRQLHISKESWAGGNLISTKGPVTSMLRGVSDQQ